MACRCGGSRCGPVIVQPPEGGADTVPCDQGQALLVSVCGPDSPEESPGEVPGPCPRAFATECRASVVNEWTYDNNGGVWADQASACGTVEGPHSPGSAWPDFSCGTGAPDVPTAYRITSWIVDGAEVVTTPVEFVNGPCLGTGTMHDNWVAALSGLDPVAVWETAGALACGGYVHALIEDLERTYGPMVIESADPGDDRTWTLGPARFCLETQYTKVFWQECDDTISISWLDENGDPVTPPDRLVMCGSCPEMDAPDMSDPGSGNGSNVVDTLEGCRCDDVNGDGTEIVRYTEIYGIRGTGGPPVLLWRYPEYEPAEPYTPVNPIECPDGEESV